MGVRQRQPGRTPGPHLKPTCASAKLLPTSVNARSLQAEEGGTVGGGGTGMEPQELSLPLCTGCTWAQDAGAQPGSGSGTCLWSNEVPSWVESGVETGRTSCAPSASHLHLRCVGPEGTFQQHWRQTARVGAGKKSQPACHLGQHNRQRQPKHNRDPAVSATV